MADFSITLTVDDNKVNDLIDALNAAWNPSDAPKTGAQLKVQLKEKVTTNLKEIYKNHMKTAVNYDITID